VKKRQNSKKKKSSPGGVLKQKALERGEHALILKKIKKKKPRCWVCSAGRWSVKKNRIKKGDMAGKKKQRWVMRNQKKKKKAKRQKGEKHQKLPDPVLRGEQMPHAVGLWVSILIRRKCPEILKKKEEKEGKGRKTGYLAHPN